ncbi:hypothetical protein [Herbiconiux liukaitaii]|uniref:hypothetical protein n=1 Tax=Herbiconiux liukaitaii TaxID=3342799 RepID=UPI0035B795AE
MLVSEPRFGAYLAHYQGDARLAARLYLWNAELTSAFWGPISILEVVLRNAVHDALRRGRADDWWNDPSVHLMRRERSMIDTAHSDLSRRGVHAPSAGQVVAATSLGLWVGLTDAGRPRDPLLSYETALWQPRLVHAFPHLGVRRRKQLHRELDDVRRFRNRLAHHEPIFRAPLEQLRDDLIAIAGCVHPDAARLIREAQRIDHVLERKVEAISAGSGSL